MLMYQFYKILGYFLLPILLFLQWRKGFRNKGYWQHWNERLGFTHFPERLPEQVQLSDEHGSSTVDENFRYDFWIHAVSVGEARAITPLVKRLLAEQPDRRILMTMSTPTGRDTVRLLLKDTVDLCYLPYDVGFCVNQFLRRARPKVAIIVETEVWPNLIVKAKKQRIPVLYVNVRLSERSFLKYQRFPKFSNAIFGRIAYMAIQGPADAARLNQLGVPIGKFSITGNIKFDVQMPASLEESARGLRGLFTESRTVWIAGSTREGEEDILLPVYKNLKQKHEDLLLIIVPRHPERFDEVAKICKRYKLNVFRRTNTPAQIDAETDVYLGDTLGELSLMYAASDIAFVGGSMVPFGGQNILEPCALGVPVVFGTHMFNFQEISELTIAANAGIQVLDQAHLERELDVLIQRPNRRDEIGNNGRALIDEHKGALENIYQLIKDLD